MIFFILPTQLFKNIDILSNYTDVYIYEHPNYFVKYSFHKMKLVLHRASMKKYLDYIRSKYKIKIKYLEYDYNINIFKNQVIHMYDPVDHDVVRFFKKYHINLYILETPLFITTKKDIDEFIGEQKNKNKLFQTSFYIYQRKRLNVLVDKKNKPIGGRWTFDKDNRVPFPKNYDYDQYFRHNKTKYVTEAKKYVLKNFSDNPGSLDLYLPIDHRGAEKQLDNFIKKELKNFAIYQDAVSSKIIFGHHSVLSPLINIGLLTHRLIIDKVLDYYNKNKKYLVQVEAYLRQIIGWNNYMRLVYTCYEKELIKSNYFNSKKKIDKSWYDGSTGISVIDNIIKKVLDYGYAHHIERLMYLSNFMLISGIKPKDMYKWFSEMFLDSYPVFMVTNVYGMGAWSAGDIMTTRPYFSSGNYIRKMSDYYKKEDNEWFEIWNALYHIFVYKNKKKLEKNYSTANAVKNIKKMSKEDMEKDMEIANNYL